jgi:hypothetical protein
MTLVLLVLLVVSLLGILVLDALLRGWGDTRQTPYPAPRDSGDLP